MAKSIVAIRDLRADFHMNPVAVASDAVAVRDFADLVRDEKSPLHSHPEDYELVRIGYYEESTGLVTGCEHALLATASQLLEAE